MKTSQFIPGPAAGAGNQQALTTGGMTSPHVSPEVSPAIDPSAQVAKPKPVYDGADVSRVIEPGAAPVSGILNDQNPWVGAFKYATNNGSTAPSAPAMIQSAVSDPGSVPKPQQAWADMLRSGAYRANPTTSPKPSWQSMGGWQSLMQRMSPR